MNVSNLRPSIVKKRIEKGLVALQHPVYRTALKHKVLAATEHEPVVRSLGPLGTILDVGANVGQFAAVARRTNPDARLIAFEPIPEAAERLRRVFAGDARFEHRPQAISDGAGRATFHLTGTDSSSSLLLSSERQVAEFPTTVAVGTIEVETARLDDVLGDPAELAGPVLLKIDTQGTELAVLRGAERTLGHVRYVLLEASFVELYIGQSTANDLVAHLLERGFQMQSAYDLRSSAATGEPIQADFLFSRG